MGINRIDGVNMILIGVLTMALLLCCSSQLYAAQEEGFIYTLTDYGAQITDYIDYSMAKKDVIIPSTLGGAPVTSIGNRAFEGSVGLTSVTIPQGVTIIGDDAFFTCRGLTSVTIPDGITSIGKGAFSGCESLESVRIPEGITNIGEGAFRGCRSISGINIPDSVVKIGAGAFAGCTSLKNITVDGDNSNYTSIDGVLYDKTRSTLVAWPGGVTDINIGESVTNIGGSAFEFCVGMTSIVIPEGVTSIGERAFFGCTNLAGITFQSSKTEVFDSEETLPTAAKIIGYDNSEAEKYAKKYYRTFEIIGSSMPPTGTPGTPTTGEEAKPIIVTVNGSPVAFDQPPVILKGRVMVPMRAIFEALEVQVNWDGEGQTITAEKGTAKIIVKIGSQQATVNGTVKNLDVPAQIIKNRTLVPVRFISESLGAEVNWDAKAQTVTIRQ